ncbi:MAG: hypothetical protein CVU09_17110 [Bacteroidetes bacterium HGW-Bacteroidetes-4]|nr:MAG: hypothetical protein CVU09_17110 [Bacteroidetes bacterium HGW-Bacteroidetes-4]
MQDTYHGYFNYFLHVKCFNTQLIVAKLNTKNSHLNFNLNNSSYSRNFLKVCSPYFSNYCNLAVLKNILLKQEFVP